MVAMRKGCKRWVLLLVHSLILIFILILIQSAAAKKVYVDIDNTEGPWDGSEEFPFNSIQAAINDANESDIIEVYSGDYHENIEINKRISINGSGAESTDIIGCSNKNTVKIKADYINLSGFSIDNTYGADTKHHCIYIEAASHCNIIENVLENGENGLYILASTDNIISQNTFQNNINKGVLISNSDENIFNQNVIMNNGDGILLQSSDSNQVNENNITNNNYGIYLTANSQNNLFYKNDFDNNYPNAYDAGSNAWSKNQQGNYWDDYQDYDNNDDGIGDSAYDIEGGDNQDSFPLCGVCDCLTLDLIAYIETISPNPALEDETITFNGHGSPSEYIVDWKWESSIDGVLHSGSADFFSSSLSVGTHFIKFKVKSNNGEWSDYDTETLMVNHETENEIPSATIVSISPQEIKKGESVYFHGYGTDIDGTVIGYNWRSSEDGVISSESTFSSASLSLGSHTISFKVKDNDGDWSSVVSETVVVIQNDSLNTNPIASMNGPYEGMVNNPLFFDASGSYDPDEDDVISSYEWDFGDGKSGSGKIIAHAYNRTGNFTVNLTVRDSNEAQTTVSSFALITNQSSNSHDDADSDNNSNGSSKDFLPKVPGFEFFFIIVGLVVVLSSKRFFRKY